MAALEAYPWRGNVRELRNALERAMLLADGSELNESHFPMLAASEGELSTGMGLPVEGINLEAAVMNRDQRPGAGRPGVGA